jgi:HAD superfamily hydrolase (TIGR01509 family)
MIFDMDGVLADTSRCHSKAYEDLWRKIQVKGPPYGSIAGRTTAEVIAQLTLELNPSPAEMQEWVRFKQEQARKYLASEALIYDDTLLSLAALTQRRIQLALGTGASRETTEIILKRLKIFDFFTIIFTAADVESGKPSPEIYLRIMTEAEASRNRTLILEDSVVGLESAVAAEAFVASVRTGHQIDCPRFIGAFSDLRELTLAIGAGAR